MKLYGFEIRNTKDKVVSRITYPDYLILRNLNFFVEEKKVRFWENIDGEQVDIVIINLELGHGVRPIYE